MPNDEKQPVPDVNETPVGQASQEEGSDDTIGKRIEVGEGKLDDILRDPTGLDLLDGLAAGSNVSLVYIDRRSGGTYVGRGARVEGTPLGPPKAIPAMGAEPRRIGTYALNPILDRELDKLRFVYLQTPAESVAWRRLSEDGFLVLVGPEGSGRRATAIHLLDRLKIGRLYEVSPDAVLGELCKAGMPEQTGLILESPPASALQGLDRFTFTGLRQQSGKRNSALIITTNRTPTSLPPECEACVIQHASLNDDTETGTARRREMLTLHLRWYLAEEAEAVEQAKSLLDEVSIQGLLEGPLQPGEIDQLAQLLVTVIEESMPLEQALARFRRQARRQVERWFAQARPLEESLLMIAAAVFNGAPYDEVTAAARSLEMLVNPPDEEDTPKRLPNFRQGRTARLEAIDAHVGQARERGEFGEVSVDTLCLNNPAWQPEVLRYVWQEDLLREPLLAWLTGYGDHPRASLRHRAGAAIGDLARHDFPGLLRQAISPWAKSYNHQQRLAVSVALGVAAWDTEVAPAVLGLLHHWATVDNWRLRWTAAAAYGGMAGMRYPQQALDDLRIVADADDIRLIQPVVQSLSALFRLGEQVPEFADWVLSGLEAWTVEGKQAAHIVGLIAFLELATPPDKPRPGPSGWRLLLHHAQKGKVGLDWVATLLRRSLNFKPTRRSALEAVRGWLEQAEVDEDHEPAIEAIVQHIASQGAPREKERLQYYLALWASDRQRAIPLAATILQDMRAKGG